MSFKVHAILIVFVVSNFVVVAMTLNFLANDKFVAGTFCQLSQSFSLFCYCLLFNLINVVFVL